MNTRIDVSDAEEQLARLETQGKTAMLIAVDGVLAGVVAVADTIKSGSREAIDAVACTRSYRCG